MKKTLFTLLAAALSCIGAQAATYSFTPKQTEQLKRTLADGSLRPGDTVVLRDGNYNLGAVDFSALGTVTDSITLRAEHPGKAVVSGPLKFCISGKYLKVEGLLFHKAWAQGKDMILFRNDSVMASNCRLTACVIDDCNNPQKSTRPGKNGTDTESEYWVGLCGTNHRVDHCYFARKKVGGLVLQLWLSDKSHLNNHQIDHNLFGDRRPYGGNGAEIIRVGHSWSSQLESHAIIESNLFLHCDGENEIISVKSCNNILRGNLFFESNGALVCRHGHYNVIEGNTFVGNNVKGSCGIRIINQGHTVYDNFMARLDGWGLLVRVGVFERPTATTDVKAEPLTSYHRPENVDIAANHFIDCRVMELGSGNGNKMPRNVRFANNHIHGAAANFRVVRPDETLPGFYFLDNRYSFADGSKLTLPGFTPAPAPTDYATRERTRVLTALTGTGPAWYAPAMADVDYVKSKY